MENRNVRLQHREFIQERSLSDAELHLLIEFFQLLDQWDRDLVQNVCERSEVNVCKAQ
jgi:succinate dehydrogenase flavin-adding protein (antitoxin of CptAB toxin-antitoxin module)